jgi:AAA ATPase domain
MRRPAGSSRRASYIMRAPYVAEVLGVSQLIPGKGEWTIRGKGFDFDRQVEMIKKIRVTNFKSLEDVSVDLEPVTVMIGQSGSGKSNFVQALRWLRDYLATRNPESALQAQGGWSSVLCATSKEPYAFSFIVTFDAPGFRDDFEYEVRLQQPPQIPKGSGTTYPPQFAEERLTLGNRVLYHQAQGNWVQPPPLVHQPQPGQLMLGALTGVQEASIAHLVLTAGIGCYAFPDSVLTTGQTHHHPNAIGLTDDGSNYLPTLIEITTNLQTWRDLRAIVASLRKLKPLRCAPGAGPVT